MALKAEAYFIVLTAISILKPGPWLQNSLIHLRISPCVGLIKITANK